MSAAPLLAQVNRLEGCLDRYDAYRAGKRWTLAKSALDNAIEEIGGPSSALPRWWQSRRVDLLFRLGQLDAVQSTVTDLLRVDAQDSDALLLRVRLHFARGELGKSISHAQTALRSDPDCVAARVLMRKASKLEGIKAKGNAAFAAFRTEEAIARWSEAIALAEENAEEDGELTAFKAALLSNRATARFRLERWRDALRDCEAALALQPDYFKALRTRARAHGKLEHYEEAVRDFQGALDQFDCEWTKHTLMERESLEDELRMAKIALEGSKKKDYYEILGISRDANDAEIKKAYHRGSLKHHPDKGGDAERFKRINEAFCVLSDSYKRWRYDLGEEDATREFTSGGWGYSYSY